MSLAQFHPAVSAWFTETYAAPTPCQVQAWNAIRAGRHTLVAAPTGSGKTFAAFLAAIDDLLRQALAGSLPDATQVVYVSPLKALSNDIQRNLEIPLAAISERLAATGMRAEITAVVRTGDTPQQERVAMRKRPPHIVVTTPESLYILLTSAGGRAMLATTRTVIVDEIHAIAASKRGAHLALSLERLSALCGDKLLRIGLSATQKPVAEVARFLVGGSCLTVDGLPDCEIIDTGHVRARDLAIEMPNSPLQAVMAGESWDEIYDRLATFIATHRTTLVFVNTRRMAERVARHLSERVGETYIAAHHGSLAREQRLDAEQRLKSGQLKALVATASLELGIDVGEVDLVCQLGSTRSIAAFLQRVGRSGHSVTGLPKGRLFPLSRDDLVECAAILDAVAAGALDRLCIPSCPLDVLAQQVVAMVACEEWLQQALFERVIRAYSYRALRREDFDAVIRMLADGFSTRRGRQSAYLHRDVVNGRLRARRGAQLTAITCGGAIPDTADYEVRQEPMDHFVGTLNEDFAIESTAGDIFQLGNTSWRILRVEPGVVRVEDAQGLPPNIPFWFGEAPARTEELSTHASMLRARLDAWLAGNDPIFVAGQLEKQISLHPAAAGQLVDYLAATRGALGAIPTQAHLVLERFFDESGGMQLVLHSPYGSRINRAWGLALRKRFCRKFNFELQAAATEDALVLSLGETHSFPLAEVFQYLRAATVREVLVQALLDAPMFTTRWRWSAGIALAIPRFRGGRKVPPRLQRMKADDLLSVVFPDQVACLENLVGQREIPDHPLVAQTLADCLHEAMDIAGLEAVLRGIESGAIAISARDLTEPSPLAQEILNAKPYAFLDDAPLEERRTQAVANRRWLDPASASDIGRLDADAIARVHGEAWPQADNADELHDALLSMVMMSVAEGTAQTAAQAEELISAARCTECRVADQRFWVAAERLPIVCAIQPSAVMLPAVSVPPELDRQWPRDEALTALCRGRLEVMGPVTAGELSRLLALPRPDIDAALLRLEAEGYALRGSFRGADELEWCERRLLARIHRYTLQRLRREIEPVSAADFMRFLFRWHGIDRDDRREGPQALAAVIEQLAGFEVPAIAWEQDVLPLRLQHYEPALLDQLCLSGRAVWTRLRHSQRGTEPATVPVRATPIALMSRRDLPWWNETAPPPAGSDRELGPAAQLVLDFLSSSGASFFDDLVDGTRLLRTQVESALAELVAKGVVTADSFAGLRALLIPESKRRTRGGRRRGPALEEAGRWTIVDLRPVGVSEPRSRDAVRRERAEVIALSLLRRYGIVCRKLLTRETTAPPWRDLVPVYHRLEARGHIRGGRFVAGLTGEQFALPDAVGLLRDIRRQDRDGRLVSVSAADPLNLAGIVLPGERVPALAGNRILFLDGQVIAVLHGKAVHMLDSDHAERHFEFRKALLRVAAAVR